MNITVVCVGKLKEKYWVDACNEYLKRLKPYAQVTVKEIPDVDPAKAGGIAGSLEREGAAIVAALPERAHVLYESNKGSDQASEASEKPLPLNNLDGFFAEAKNDTRDGERKTGWFTNRCEEIANCYLLSRRETEVLFFLAKNYNASYIQEKLCISRSTAKTHIAHIYRKLDIHTQNELIHMVEEGREKHDA